uniref:Uncharacterized protein n=1 Tax=Heterorhabditis bacteriophora TaxID=37862 RepID=A0A1I7X8J8_HETBA
MTKRNILKCCLINFNHIIHPFFD